MISDFTGPDCRFLSVKQGQTVDVYFRLLGRTTEIWAGNAGNQFGYFPKDLLEIIHIFADEQIDILAQKTDFVCLGTGYDQSDSVDIDLLSDSLSSDLEASLQRPTEALVAVESTEPRPEVTLVEQKDMLLSLEMDLVEESGPVQEPSLMVDEIRNNPESDNDEEDFSSEMPEKQDSGHQNLWSSVPESDKVSGFYSFLTELKRMVLGLLEQWRPGRDFPSVPWESLIMSLSSVTSLFFYWKTLSEKKQSNLKMIDRMKAVEHQMEEYIQKVAELEQKEQNQSNLKMIDRIKAVEQQMEEYIQKVAELEQKDKNLSNLKMIDRIKAVEHQMEEYIQKVAELEQKASLRSFFPLLIPS
ncbi:hypothetical protein UPYG_G00057730 [Umbra pygmaea]|uniref:SH3 domain-containing protein n=1 Tax=Umbra pygmaea TaxID=75934 RepID=A0ABD0XBQ2_UMBPY